MCVYVWVHVCLCCVIKDYTFGPAASHNHLIMHIMYVFPICFIIFVIMAVAVINIQLKLHVHEDRY